ncbi:MAG TPA: hypothetical protein RMG48_02910 [Myxococcales bacterium LLY-WYZ-16_1]|jgi:predicted regulator of Ras-like GTPase activity (Roadblock/LC7/MglB family)|nr:hypothetical protein [Myxococcales bacterium LLY-WYZ-16_1]
MSSEFRVPLESICHGLPDAVAATLMGADGIPVETVERDPAASDEPDVPSLLVEFSSLLGQMRRSAQMFAAGPLEEVSIASERLVTIIRPLNEEYFVAVALRPGSSSTSKGRYLLRVQAPRLAAALS